MSWENCEREEDHKRHPGFAGKVTRTNQFFTDNESGTVSLTGGQDGDANNHFYKCHWKKNTDYNSHRPCKFIFVFRTECLD
ncbi:hypothetical protein MJO29_003515 [Puccinia striiformis f. sp. tritici]|nr:hypothetical protein MJO29_003515 [Puccinia striiformis f. sp. tritici]